MRAPLSSFLGVIGLVAFVCPALADGEVGHANPFQSPNVIRCGTPEIDPDMFDGGPGDCSSSSTSIEAQYDPGDTYYIQVVVHVIRDDNGFGNVGNPKVRSQIDILNEDFLALAGTPGEPGTFSGIQFALASQDPDGNATNGITRSNNTTWFNDGGQYWLSLNWDPSQYLNIYTNNAGGALGYVPYLPQTGSPGSASDRVVCLWSAFGRNSIGGPPYDQGRTATHEVGHYCGLFHTFQSGCGTQSQPGCYSSGDRICDTNGESGPHFGCPSTATCGTQDPIHNYMDYTDDTCMWEFTPEQVNRMRCTLEHYRGSLINAAVSAPRVATAANVEPMLFASRPNPFRGSTDISFNLPTRGPVTLRVIDVTGRAVATLASGERSKGMHTVTWNGMDDRNAPAVAGVYFYRLDTQQGSETKRLVLHR